MKTNANSIRVGNVIEYQNQLWSVIRREHVKPGKGGAYIQVEMKNIVTGTKTNTRYNSSEDVDVAYVEQKNYQFQYFRSILELSILQEKPRKKYQYF